jgi:RNA polymerase sigma-70 factor (ECF subfamily)
MDACQVAGPSSTELDLLSAAREGRQESGRSLMAEHGPSMVRTARNVLGRYGGSEAEDVVQEAFIAALTTTALPTGDLGAWLRAVTARKALDWLRRARRRREAPLVEPDDATGRLGVEGGTSSRIDVLAVREGLGRLSPADRAVLTLVDLEGWSMTDAARALGLTSVAARIRAVRARRKLGRVLRAGRGPDGMPPGKGGAGS